MAHDLKAPLQEQVDHHRHVVAQEDLAVIQLTVVEIALQRRHCTGQMAAHGDQGLLKQAFRLLHHLGFAGIGPGGVFAPGPCARILGHRGEGGGLVSS